jgi:hypothetical protein
LSEEFDHCRFLAIVQLVGNDPVIFDSVSKFSVKITWEASIMEVESKKLNIETDKDIINFKT